MSIPKIAWVFCPVGFETCRQIASLHNRTFRQGMAGLTERRGNGADTFWTASLHQKDQTNIQEPAKEDDHA